MHDLEGKYEELYAAIGRAASNWISLEENIRHFLVNLAMYADPSFENERPIQTLYAIIINMDMRGMVASAKALAHEVTDPTDFYDRTEALLNVIDNEYRNERNRFIHDEWMITSPQLIRRYKRGSVVRRTQAFQREVTGKTERRFGSIDEIRAFADKLRDADNQIFLMTHELLDVLDRTRPHPE